MRAALSKCLVPYSLANLLYPCRDGEVYYTDIAPPASLMESFKERADNQIMGLEIASIALGISTFATMIEGRNVKVWGDNTSAEAATRRGSARSFDHTCLVHAIWKRTAQLRLAIYVDRVPTAENIADLPSREK